MAEPPGRALQQPFAAVLPRVHAGSVLHSFQPHQGQQLSDTIQVLEPGIAWHRKPKATFSATFRWGKSRNRW